MAPPSLPLDLLDREWTALVRSPHVRAWFDTWRTSAAPMLPCTSLDEMVAFFENRGRSRAHDDAVFRGLASSAAAGDATAVRVLVHLLMPGWRSLTRRYEWLLPADELQAVIVSLAYERISTYPVARRPGNVAANVLGDTQQWLLRRLRHLDREIPTPRPPDIPPPWAPPEDVLTAGEELLDLLCTAVEDGLLDGKSATLIARTRFGACTIRELARLEGVDPDTIRHRRQRAELRLRSLAA